jgi:predicted rRNA methylase YqxC with S4 and FtsJ domains
MRALIGKPFDVIVVDVSFIGLEKIIPSLLPLMKENARLASPSRDRHG